MEWAPYSPQRRGGATRIASAIGETWTVVAKAGAHVITQGTIFYMQGGKFLGGALSGSFASVSNDLLGLAVNKVGANNILRSNGFALFNGAVSGGVGSVLGGGNFWMGAGQGLIVTAFNFLAHKPKSTFKVVDSDGDYVGKMKVTAYELYTNPANGEQGIHIELQFTSASKKYSDHKWVQTVGTNSPDGNGNNYSIYNDHHLPYENKGPFYYAKSDYITYPQIKQGNQYIFTDVPTRSRLSTPIGWRAELSLVGFNSSGPHAIHTLYYGFNLYPSGHSLTMPLTSIPYRNRYPWLKK